MRRPLLAIAAALALALPASAGWRWDGKEGFVEDPAVQVSASPQSAEELAAVGEFARAARRYRAIAEAAGADVDVYRLAWLKCGDALILLGDWSNAYDAYDKFAVGAETYTERERAGRFQVEACIMGVQNGAAFDFFGIIRGAQWSAKHGRELLTVYPYEDWSASARIRFAGALLSADRYEEAVIEYEFLLKDFQNSAWTPTSRFRKGEAHLSQFMGMPYDAQPLADARREFQKYLDDYPTGDKTDAAKARLGDLDELEAERDWRASQHYDHLRKWRSTRLYLKEIIRKYPKTSWADKAREELPSIEAKVAKMAPLDREKAK